MKTEKKNRAVMISFIIHLMILVLVLYPFTRIIESDQTESASIQFIEIAFENGDMSPGKASTKPEVIEKKEIEKKEDVSDHKIEEATEIKEAREEQNEFVDEEAQDVLMEEGDEEEFIPEEKMKKADGGDAEFIQDHEGDPESDAGEGEVGDEITGTALANMDFDGEGVFGRRIIYHADIARLAEKEGRVVVNLCINKAGRVTHVAFNRDDSTITDSDYVREVMRVATKYKFEQDFSAPSTQCGKLTFIFKFD